MSWGRLTEFASRHYGIVCVADRSALGISRAMWDGWVKRGRILRVHPRTYRVAGVPESWRQRLYAATCAGGDGALVSHRSVGALWRLLPPTDLVEIAVPVRRRTELDGVIVHRLIDDGWRFATRRDGIPVANPLLAMVQLGAVLPPWEVGDALERGVRDQLFTVAAAESIRMVLRRRGRDGVGVLGGVLDDRALGDARADGLLEPRMARIFRDYGLPVPAFQHAVRHDGRSYRIDFAYPALMLAIEVDGWIAHTSPADLQRNIDKQNALVELGWTIVRFTWTDVVKRPAYVATTIRRNLHAQRS